MERNVETSEINKERNSMSGVVNTKMVALYNLFQRKNFYLLFIHHLNSQFKSAFETKFVFKYFKLFFKIIYNNLDNAYLVIKLIIR